MEIRKSSSLARLFKGPQHPINEDYAELKFIRAACAGDVGAADTLFFEEKLFGGKKSAVDAPHGRFEGLGGIREFIATWLKTFHADSAEVIPVIQTRANGRSVSEVQVDFVVDGMIEQVPMFVVGDLRTQDTLDEVRIYCHCSYVPGIQAYRRPMFTPAHLEMGDPQILTGAVREYYEALHHVPAVDVDRIIGCMEEGCIFGGYGPDTPEAKPVSTLEEDRKVYEMMALYIPRCVGMRYETLIDDGRTGIIEWVHIVSDAGYEERGRVAMSGIAAYERGKSGKLCAIRISDYAGLERTIDWSKLDTTLEEARAVNHVHEFPAGVGRKPQS